MRLISQSLIKSLNKYINGKQCGLKLKAQYVDGIEFEPSDAMRLGQWFEYKCTGQKTKFGHTPVPDRLKPKKLTKAQKEAGLKQEDIVGELSKKYQDALIQVEAFHKMLKAEKLTIISTGTRLKDDEFGISGDVDIVAQREGDDKLIFIDTKYSGLLENKYDDLGWHYDSLEYKHDIMIQSVQYKLLGIQNYGYEPDFYFWVFSSTNPNARKSIKVEVSEDRFKTHIKDVFQARKIFEQNLKHGFKPYPSPDGCASCPLKETCEHFTEVPIVHTVYYGN